MSRETAGVVFILLTVRHGNNAVSGKRVTPQGMTSLTIGPD